jgi:hypothetical protein
MRYTAPSAQGDKLQDPARVIKALSSWVYDNEDLVTGEKRRYDVDVQRPEHPASIKKCVNQAQRTREAEELLDIRFELRKTRWKVQVHWRGSMRPRTCGRACKD